MNIQIRGPLFTSYSLAIINRNLALALDKLSKHNITVYANERNSDFVPSAKELSKFGRLGEIFTTNTENQDIVIAQTYPHDSFDELNGKFNFGYIAWEDTYFPLDSVKLMNTKMDGLFVMSEYVKEIAIRSGVKIPVEVLRPGIEMPQNDIEPYRFNTDKNFKFLHVSSAVPRKGVDILIKSYFEEFSSQDDCVLIIKTTPNIHNENLSLLIKDYQNKKGANSPEIILIYDDVSKEDIWSMYKASNAIVLPTRAEGFGLPQAEAMVMHKPLLTTGFSAHMDFCNSENSFLIDYTLVESDSHTSERIGYWAEPSQSDLQSKMRFVLENQNSEEITTKLENAYETIIQSFTWEKCADELDKYLHFFKDIKSKKINLGVITTWDTKDGIAKYSEELYSNIFEYVDSHHIISSVEMPLGELDNQDVSRIWTPTNELDLQSIASIISDNKINNLHIQYHPGFFSINEIIKLANYIGLKDLNFIITLHSLEELKIILKNHQTLQKIADKLNQSKFITHREDEAQFLRDNGFVNVICIPIANKCYPDSDKKLLRSKIGLNSNHIIASHGYLLPHKGFAKVVDSVKELKTIYPDILYILLSPHHESNSELSYIVQSEIERKISEFGLTENIMFIQEYLPHREIITLLQAADMVLLPYDEVPDSASGAIRACISSRRPVVVSKAQIFDDVRKYVYTLEDTNIKTIADFIDKFYIDSNLNKKESLEKYFDNHSLQNISKKTLNLYK